MRGSRDLCVTSLLLCDIVSDSNRLYTTDSLSPRVAVTQLSVFNCRLESNICACFIENSWKIRIKCPNWFYF